MFEWVLVPHIRNNKNSQNFFIHKIPFIGKLKPRIFPVSLPKFPIRKRDGNIPIAAGFETMIHRLVPLDAIRRKELSPVKPNSPSSEVKITFI